MDAHRLQRIAGICGIVALVLGLVSFFIPAYPPAADADPAKIVTFYANHRTGILVQGYVAGLSDALLMLFILAVAVYFYRHGASRGAVAVLAIGGVLGLVLDLGGVAVLSGLAFASNSQLEPSVARSLYDIGTTLRTSTVYFPTALFAVGAALAVFETGVLARWMGWFALVIAAGSILSPLLPIGSPATILAFLAFIVWMVIVAVKLIQEPATAEAPRPDYGVRPAGAM